jgi:TRAP-type C4-dicarboxylate transport system permease small subunit
MGKVILRFIRYATAVSKVLTIIAAGSMAALMIVNVTDIIGTKFFLRSVPGALDISEELMVLVTLLPIAFLALERGHIRITLLEDRLPGWGRYFLRVVQHVICMLIMGFVSYRVFVQFQKTVKVVQLKQGIDLPIWPANLAVVVAFGFLTLVYALLLARALIYYSDR